MVDLEQLIDALRADLSADESGRGGEPREVAEMIVFLLSDRASYITGVEIAVAGGGAERAPLRPVSRPAHI